RPAVEGFRQSVQEAGASTKDGKGMWAGSSFEDLVQYNDGFKTRLIGTPEEIAGRIIAFKEVGVNLMLTCYLHFAEEVADFRRVVLPIVRENEKELGRGRGTELNSDLLLVVPGVSAEEAARAADETLAADHPAKTGAAAKAAVPA